MNTSVTTGPLGQIHSLLKLMNSCAFQESLRETLNADSEKSDMGVNGFEGIGIW